MAQPPHHSAHRSWFPSLYESVTFLSGFLLFHAQPLIAKYILAWFGGGFGVWMTTVLFFEIACPMRELDNPHRPGHQSGYVRLVRLRKVRRPDVLPSTYIATTRVHGLAASRP